MEQEMEINNEEVNILVVEDSLTQAVQLQDILERSSYSVSVVNNGKEALKYLENNTPTMIISDIVMPEMDGYELCRCIKKSEKFKNIPVILLTSLTDPEDIIRGLEYGANNFINKPYEEEFLLARLQYILVNQKLRKEEKSSEITMEIFFRGKKYHLDTGRTQILDILLATYEDVVKKSKELEKTNRELREALETIKSLRGLIPICSFCKNMRDDSGYWQKVEEYIKAHTEVQLSHSICPDCAKKHFPGYKV